MSYISNPLESTTTYEQYLGYVADFNASDKKKLELLYIVHSILSHFVDQAFGVQTDQITLQSVAKPAFNTPLGHDKIGHHPETQTADAQRDGVGSDFNPIGASEP